MMGAWCILMRAPMELAGMTLVSKGRADSSRANLIGMLERSQVFFIKVTVIYLSQPIKPTAGRLTKKTRS